MEDDFKNKILPIMDRSLQADNPSSTEADELNLVYKKSIHRKSLKPKGKKINKRFVDAIKDCLFDKMNSDSKVLIMGQDIAEYGGVF